jgi:hypothetical protein
LSASFTSCVVFVPERGDDRNDMQVIGCRTPDAPLSGGASGALDMGGGAYGTSIAKQAPAVGRPKSRLPAGAPTTGGVAGALAAPWKQARGFDSPAVHPLLAGPVYLSYRCFESNR